MPKLRDLINDETIDSFDYNINHNLGKGLDSLIKEQWKIIYEVIVQEDKVNDYLSNKDFELKATEILGWEGDIGSTDQDLIRWKTHEIMKLAGIPIDRTKE